MTIVKIDAVGGGIWRVLDDREQKVAEFYREGDAERFVRFEVRDKFLREIDEAVAVFRTKIDAALGVPHAKPDRPHAQALKDGEARR